MTNNTDKIGNYHSGKAEDAGYKTESGNHAAGIEANDTPAANREPNLDNQSAGNLQRSADGITGANIMTADQSIGGQGAQDGIRGTPSGTQGAQSGQGIDQGRQGSQGQSRQSGSEGQDRGGIGSQPSGNQMSTNQSGSQSGSLQAGSQQSDPVHRDDDASAPGAGVSQRGTGGNQQSSDGSVTSTHGGSGGMADKLQGGPENQQGSGQGLPTGPGSLQSDRHQGMQGQGDEPGHDIDDIGNKQSGGAGSRGGDVDDQR